MSSAIELRDGCKCGGGRGIFAMRRIGSGELLLAERPTLHCPEPRAGETRHVAGARQLLAMRRAVGADGRWRAEDAHAVELLETLHPRSLDELRTGLGPEPRAALRAEVDYLRRQPQADDGAPARGDDEVLRLLLQVRMNAFDSGIFCMLSMINHNCAPNAIKFGTAHDRLGRSRVSALREIEAGEEICIHYLSERLLSRAARSAALLEQHYFAISESPFRPPLELKYAATDANSPSCGRISSLVDLLEAALDEVDSSLAAAREANGEGEAKELARASSALRALIETPAHALLKKAGAEHSEGPTDAQVRELLRGHLAWARLNRTAAAVLSDELARDTSRVGGGDAHAAACTVVLVLRASVELSERAYRNLYAPPASAPLAPGAPAVDADASTLVLPHGACDHALGAHYEVAGNALGFLLANEPALLLSEFHKLWPTRGRAAAEHHRLLEAARHISRLYADHELDKHVGAGETSGAPACPPAAAASGFISGSIWGAASAVAAVDASAAKKPKSAGWDLFE
ncbi:hypothetical protein T492DRAFT_985107 [Pavlovales sp. CCMP2436]|nr:hypothetical protein T492DRAFT_985107 [Pavlovales sp. CCMP2436]